MLQAEGNAQRTRIIVEVCGRVPACAGPGYSRFRYRSIYSPPRRAANTPCRYYPSRKRIHKELSDKNEFFLDLYRTIRIEFIFKPALVNFIINLIHLSSLSVIFIGTCFTRIYILIEIIYYMPHRIIFMQFFFSVVVFRMKQVPIRIIVHPPFKSITNFAMNYSSGRITLILSNQFIRIFITN